MKQLFSHKNLHWFVLGAGAAGFILKAWHMLTQDKRGFYARGHISAILLCLISVLVAVGLLLYTRRMRQGSKYDFNFPGGFGAALGTFCAAAAYAVTGVKELLTAADGFSQLMGAAGILAAMALVYVGICSWRELRSGGLWHIGICVYLVLRLFYMYRSWRIDPQVMDYAYQLMALACLCLSVYHRATFDIDEGKRRSYALFSLLSVYFCCVTLAGGDSTLLYMGSGIWMFTNLCDLTPMPKEFREEKE